MHPTKSASSGAGITARSMILGVVLSVMNAYWLAYTSEMMSSFLTFLSLFLNAIFCLFALIAINRPLTRYAPGAALSRQELLVVYIMVVMVSTIGGHTTMTFLISAITQPRWFATPENQWAELFGRFIPDWFVPLDSALPAYYRGESSLYTVTHARGWVIPVLVWTAFITALWCAFLCINVLIRQQWTERENLAFPIARLPLEMTGVRRGAFWTRPAMWMGFALAGGIELLIGLDYLFPSIPAFRVKGYELDGLFTSRPWDRIGWVPITAFPFIIGLTYFVPLDLSFSGWFFYVMRKLERVFRLGVLGQPELHFSEREGGAWIAIGLLAIWGTRRHLTSLAVSLVKTPRDADGRPTSPNHRPTVVALVLSLVFVSMFLVRAGVSGRAVVGFLALTVVIGVGVTRIRAELGPPSHEIFALDPTRLMVLVFGAKSVGMANMTALSFTYWLNRLNIAHPMPNQMEAFRMGERRGISRRGLVGAMMVATVVGCLGSFWAYLHLMYRFGADTVPGSIVGVGYETFGERLMPWLLGRGRPDAQSVNALSLGFVVTCALYWLRHRFVGWPLHPIGYAMTAATFGGLSDFWSSVFLGWLAKALILRFFGLRAFRAAAPFFLGLVLGDYVVACVWSLIGTIFRIPTYSLWP